MPKKAYFILEITVHHPEGMQPYLDKAADSLIPYQGHMMISGVCHQSLEGTPPHGKTVVIEFPSITQAQAWYQSDLYQSILPARLSSATNRSYFIEGLENELSK